MGGGVEFGGGGGLNLLLIFYSSTRLRAGEGPLCACRACLHTAFTACSVLSTHGSVSLWAHPWPPWKGIAVNDPRAGHESPMGSWCAGSPGRFGGGGGVAFGWPRMAMHPCPQVHSGNLQNM